jgi:pilus assembly protein CpaC
MMKSLMKSWTKRLAACFAVALIVVTVLPPRVRAEQVAARATVSAGDAAEPLDLMVGRSMVIRMDRPITRVSLSTPDIADAMVTTPYELLVHGKTPGTISLLVWADTGRIKTYDVAVRRDLSALEQHVRRLFPGEPITVGSNGKDVVLSGVVSSKFVAERASSVAVGYVEKPENVVNLLRQQEGVATNQVMLKVRFAEVNRSAAQELGASFFTGPNGRENWIGRTTTQQFPAPDFDQDKGLVFGDFLNFFAFNTEEQLGVAIKALKERGLFQSLAEPNLITQDGKEASFLAGGEYPYPVLQGSGVNASITIVFKEFGIRLRFTPTVLGGDVVRIKVMPEVSTLDFANAVTLEGFRIPALATRRMDTEVELRDGQTFAIAGLLDNHVNETLRRVPGIGDIPILGYLFRSRAYQKNTTELVVMITPHIVRRDSPGVTPTLPGLVQPFLGQPERRLAPPPPAFTPQSQSGQQSQPVATSAGAVRPERAQAVQAPAPKSVQAPAAPPAPSPASMVQTPEVQAPSVPQLTEAQRRGIEEARAQEARQRGEQQKRAEQLRKQEEERARVQASLDAERLKKEQEESARARKGEQARLEQEQKLAVKRAAEQGALDRKRWLDEQQQAARAREVADKLAKEQARRQAEQAKLDAARLEEERKLAEKHKKAEEKLAKEQAGRDPELSRLVLQHRKLTEAQSTPTTTNETAKD